MAQRLPGLIAWRLLLVALAGDAEWRSFHLEAGLFIGLICWIGGCSMSRFSRGIESKVGAGGTAA